VTATTWPPRPSANSVSVAPGSSETIRTTAEPTWPATAVTLGLQVRSHERDTDA
jgi:hypothetical protein